MMGMAARLNKVGRLAFSSIANPQLTDWEYTTKIQQSLHQNDINEALKYLINVSLHLCRVISMAKSSTCISSATTT